MKKLYYTLTSIHGDESGMVLLASGIAAFLEGDEENIQNDGLDYGYEIGVIWLTDEEYENLPEEE